MLAVLSVMVFGVGAFGFYQYGKDHGGVTRWDALYYSLQLFVLEPPHLDQPINGFIEGARWAAALLSSLSVVVVVRMMLRRQLLEWRRTRAADHTVICGDDDRVLELVRTLRARDRRSGLWLLTSDDASAETIPSQVAGVHVLAGRPDVLIGSMSVHRARQVIIAGNDDSTNVAIAAQVSDACRRERTVATPLVCQVQIQSVDLRESLRRFSIPAEQSRSYVRSFDFFEQAARRLLTTTMPLDDHGIAERDTRGVHLIVLGGNEWALAVAACAARLGHFANRRRLRLSVVTADLDAWERSLFDRYPAFRDGDVCDYHGVPHHPGSREALTWLAERCDEPDVHVVVVGCSSDDAEALKLVSDWSQVVRRPKVPLALRISRAGGLVSLLTDRARADGMRLVPFGWLDEAACASFLEDDVREDMAKLVQVQFRTLAVAQGRKPIVDRAVAHWSELALEDYKESNRHQVDHIPIKLRAVGCEPASLDDPRPAVTWTPGEVELLAEMEHARWMAERRVAGWSFDKENEKKDERARTNPNLVPWGQLTDAVKDYDRDAVMNIPDLFREVTKQKLTRAASPASR